MTETKLSVIVTTYNSPDFLALTLKGLADQVRPGDFEVLVADDGSGEETHELVHSFKGRIPVTHVWQEDTGFRVARVRNLAALASCGQYLIFLDGDCVPQRTFVQRHRRLARDGWLVSGERIFLTADATKRIVARKEISDLRRSLVSWTLGSGRAMVDRPFRLINVGFGIPRSLLQRSNWTAVESSNMAIGRDAFLDLNGFDEEFVGWGYEDSDLAFRAVRRGLRIRDGRFSLGVFHLWHPIRSRSQEDSNKSRLEDTRRSGRYRALTGVDQHQRLPDSPGR